MKTALLTDFFDPKIKKLCHRLENTKNKINEIICLHDSEHLVGNNIPICSLNSFFDKAKNQEIIALAESLYEKWSCSYSNSYAEDLCAFPKYIRIELQCRLIELLKFIISLNIYINNKKPDKIVVYNLNQNLVIHLDSLLDIPFEVVTKHTFTLTKAHKQKLRRLIYMFLIVPKNILVRTLNSSLLKKPTIVLAGGKVKSGPLYKELFKRGYHIISLGAALPFWNNILLGGEGIMLDTPSKNNFSLPPLLSTIPYQGINLSDSFNLILSSFGNTFNRHIYLKTLLEKRPDIVYILINNDPQNYSALAQDHALKNKIPSAILQHGVYGSPHTLINYKSDKLFVWGKMAEKWFIENNIPKQKIIITGCPAYKTTSLNIDENEGHIKHVLLLALSWFEQHSPTASNINYKMIEVLKRAISFFPDKKLLIKLHPRQSIKELKTIEDIIANNNQVSVTKSGHLPRLLKECSICFSHNSSTGLEAIMNGRLFVKADYYSLTNKQHIYNLSNKITVVNNEKETMEILTKILNKPSLYRELLEKEIEFYRSYVSFDSIRATQVMADIIDKTIISNAS